MNLRKINIHLQVAVQLLFKSKGREERGQMSNIQDLFVQLHTLTAVIDILCFVIGLFPTLM